MLRLRGVVVIRSVVGLEVLKCGWKRKQTSELMKFGQRSCLRQVVTRWQ